MDWGGPGFIVALVMISTFGWVMTSWIRARHGYPLENEWSGVTHKDGDPAARRQVDLLASENSQLKSQVSRLEERIAVLERIATDPATRTAHEIESLRQG